MNNKFKHWSSKVNGWVFLSHSSKDYEEVKVIRDYLELNNFNAIMFYLHSLNDPTQTKEVQNLIFNEIDARNIFVSCNSDNTDKSHWVQLEKKYVSSKKNIIKIDIYLDNLKIRRCSELSKLDDLMIRSSIYILAPSNEIRIQDTIEFLSGRGFKIYEVDEIKYAKGQKRLELIQGAFNETRETNSTLIIFIHDNQNWKEEVYKIMNNYKTPPNNIILVDLNMKFLREYWPDHAENIINLDKYRDNFDEYLQILEEKIWSSINSSMLQKEDR